MAEKISLTREAALTAKPVAAEILHSEPLPDGGQRVTVAFQPTKLQRYLLRISDKTTKKFELDPFGVALLELCDGQKNVRFIIKRFTKDHDLNPREAERAVLNFLETLVRRGLVSMIVNRR